MPKKREIKNSSKPRRNLVKLKLISKYFPSNSTKNSISLFVATHFNDHFTVYLHLSKSLVKKDKNMQLVRVSLPGDKNSSTATGCFQVQKREMEPERRSKSNTAISESQNWNRGPHQPQLWEPLIPTVPRGTASLSLDTRT